MSAPAASLTADQLVTVVVDDYVFGLPIGRVQDVFRLGAMTRVPLAPPDVLGLANLRGRVVTALDLRRRLGFPARSNDGQLAVGVEAGAEQYGLVVDAVGDVVRLGHDSLMDASPGMVGPWADVIRGVYRHEERLLIALDVDALLSIPDPELAP